MSDYIKREDAENALLKQFNLPYEIIKNILKDVPSADVVSRKDYESMEHTVALLNAEIMSNIMSQVKVKTIPYQFKDDERKVVEHEERKDEIE